MYTGNERRTDYIFYFWEDAKENMVQAGKERMRKLVLKYGEKPDEDDMDEADWFEYQAVKKYEDEVTGEMNRGEFLCQRKANIYDLSRIFDKTADEARQVFNLAAKKSVNLLPETVKHAYYEAERLTPIKISTSMLVVLALREAYFLHQQCWLELL